MPEARRVGVNLLTCSMEHEPIHYQSMRWAVESLLDSDLLEHDWRLVVVDNASNCPHTINFLQQLETENERVAIEWRDENLGIAKGRNLGYQLLQQWHAPEYVVEIHTDHVFPPPPGTRGGAPWLTPIVEYMDDPRHARAGIVSPTLVTSGGQWGTPALPYPGCRCGACHGKTRGMPFEKFRAELGHLATVWRDPTKVRPGQLHPAVRRWALVEELDLRDADSELCVYDPDMPGRQNFEDTEEAYRAHKAGWQILIHFGAVAYHHYHLTRLGLSDHGADYDMNAKYCNEKHGPD